MPELTDLKSEEAGDRAMRDLALQGPNSMKILKELMSEEEVHELDKMQGNELDFYDLNGAETMIARTGYTGERSATSCWFTRTTSRNSGMTCLNRVKSME